MQNFKTLKGGEKLNEFEKQVRHALIDHQMTLTDLANELGVSVSYVYELIKGTRKSEEQKEKIRNILGLRDNDEAAEG